VSTSLGEKIRTLRKSQKMSLDQLSEASKTAKSFLWEIEKGRRNPTIEKAKAIAAALGVTTSFLAGEEEKVKSTPQDAMDHAFFRKFRGLPPETKRKIQDLVNVWSKG
jgi:transcriptional regulator with XRE-family HTH domain